MKGKPLFLDADIVLMVVLGVFAGAFLIETRSYNPTAALFPRLVSIISLIFIIWTIAQRCLALRRKAKASPEAEAGMEKGRRGARMVLEPGHHGRLLCPDLFAGLHPRDPDLPCRLTPSPWIQEV